MTFAGELRDAVGLFLFLLAFYGILTSDYYSTLYSLAYAFYAVVFLMEDARGRAQTMSNRNKMTVLALTFIGTTTPDKSRILALLGFIGAEFIITVHEYIYPKRGRKR